MGDGVDQQEQCPGDGRRPGHVEPAAGPLGPRLVETCACRDEECNPDGDIDEEDPPPRQVLGQDPAEQGSGRAAAGGHRAPHPERLGPGPLIAEGDGEDGQCGRREHGGAHPLEAAGGDQRGLVRGEAAQQAGHGEQPEAEEEDEPAAEQVG